MSWLADAFLWLLSWVIGYAREHPLQAFLFAAFVVRLFGTTVQTGWKGVLFSFGRARKELEPGFHLLIPFVQRVRKTPMRSITLHLPMQRITTADGLVYDVQANVIYRIVDPIKALVLIADFRKGCEAVLPVIIQDLLSAQTRAQLQQRKPLDEEFAVRAGAKLERWGATVEQAGFLSIAPTSKTLRLTQLGLLTTERNRMLRHYLDEGLAPELAVTLLGADRKASAHSTSRYRARSRQMAALRKAHLKAFLAEARQRLVLELIKIGHPHEEAVAHAAANPLLLEHAATRARLASRGTAGRRRRHVATAPPAPAAVDILL